jgi:hypothetical protein
VKIAIIGNNQAAVNLARKFIEIDASVTVFSTNKLESIDTEIRECLVTQVSKLNLLSSEAVPDRSRLCDLFRVTFEMNTSKNLELQKKDNPSVFENLSQSMISTLKGKIEMAEDFDLVIDLTSSSSPRPIGKAGAFALNERVYTNHENFLLSENQQKMDGDCFIYGWGNDLAKILVEVSKKEDDYLAYVFYPKGKNREDFIRSVSKIYLTSLNDYFKKLDDALQENKKNHQKELEKWNSLEDYERVKFPKPSLKELSLQEFLDMGVVSIDRLDEHDKFFVTYEPYSKFDQSAQTEVKTLGVKYIFNAQKNMMNETNYLSLNSDEDGLFKFGEIEEYEVDELFNQTLNEIKKYFSKN